MIQNGPLLDGDQRRKLIIMPITKEEVWSAVLTIGDDKAPGTDGFSAKFFKSSWTVIGPNVVAAIQDFFLTGRLLRSVNTTLITLVPKSSTANHIKTDCVLHHSA